jgi:hypothetical protein
LQAQTATDAKREAAALAAKLDAGTRLVGRNDASLREVREEWQTWAATNLAPRTVAMYDDLLDRRVLPLLGPETKAAALTVAHVRRMIDQLNAAGHSGAYVRQHITALSSVLRFAERAAVDHNACDRLVRGDLPLREEAK